MGGVDKESKVGKKFNQRPFHASSWSKTLALVGVCSNKYAAGAKH